MIVKTFDILVFTLLVEAFIPVTFCWAHENKEKTEILDKLVSSLEEEQFRIRLYNDDGTPWNWDELSFADGKFISEICKPFGFTKSPYWIRFEEDTVHFRAEIVSPTHGTMRWKGVIQGDKIKGSVVWIRERWYWTSRRRWDFSGALQE